jgi:hypothetical protein
MQEGDSLCGHHKFNALVSVVQAHQFYTVRFSLLQLLRPSFSQATLDMLAVQFYAENSKSQPSVMPRNNMQVSCLNSNLHNGLNPS